LPNSQGSLPIGLQVNGITAGLEVLTTGQVNLIASGRGSPVQFSLFDPAGSGTFSEPFVGVLDPTTGAMKIGVYGATPAVQAASPSGNTATTNGGGSGAIGYADAAYTGGLGSTGYTIGDVVLALKTAGWLAQ